jgi:hypothetical protein
VRKKEIKPGRALPSLDECAAKGYLGLQKRAAGGFSHKQRRSLTKWAEEEGGIAEAARLHSSTGPGSSAWLSAVPSQPTLTLAPSQFLIAVRLRLGLPLPECQAAHKCGLCGKQMDMFGDHLLGCTKGGEWLVRHDMIKGVYGTILADVGITARPERLLTGLGVEGSGYQRMDNAPVIDGQVEFFDNATVHPRCASYVKEAAKTPGFTADRAVKEKYKKYQSAVNQRFRLTPLVGETYGRWGKETVEFVDRMATLGVERMGREGDRRFKAALKGRWWALLAVAVQKGNAIIISERSMSARAGAGGFRGTDFGELMGRGG